MEIRQLTKTDSAIVKEFLSIEELINEEFYDYEGPEELMEAVDNKLLDVFGAIEDNKLVALIACTDFYDIGRVRRIIVHFDYRKKGIGSKMLLAVEDHFKQQNKHRLEVFVKAGDRRGSSFLKNHGYKVKSTALTGDNTYEKVI
ncbi:MAG: GNAT family N-acetyltransferase [Candidatus Heimdallarchaeota archaeon]|nr:GNAT family N-acetyltransferase [Candidatus Heimdallarchaeota archaeon]